MKSAIGVLPDRSIEMMSSALSASRDLRMTSSSLRLCGDAVDLMRGFATFFTAGFAAAFLAADLLASLLASALRAAALPAGVLLADALLAEALLAEALRPVAFEAEAFEAGALLEVDDAREGRAGRFVDRVSLLGWTGTFRGQMLTRPR